MENGALRSNFSKCLTMRFNGKRSLNCTVIFPVQCFHEIQWFLEFEQNGNHKVFGMSNGLYESIEMPVGHSYIMFHIEYITSASILEPRARNLFLEPIFGILQRKNRPKYVGNDTISPKIGGNYRYK